MNKMNTPSARSSLLSIVATLLLVLAAPTTTSSYVIPPSHSSGRTTQLSATSSSPENDDGNVVGRRDVLRTTFAALTAGVALGNQPKEASASYSAYTAREQDWQARQANGEIQYSTARSLRSQLQEIVPQNSENKKMYCPNGPSASVTPMMENMCSDVRLATPSVYGRTEDTVGNSIPGFKGGRYPSAIPGDSTSLSASPIVGGFPSYK
eukprot:CAMPEP_0185725218 /NCGR_PEP_ID=MMETSP1171-20130828/1516_1 /TAXON_ID=374046 /ORGANISM="Helicotheca tamensis, Strain CCMP826" /LENGTH=208 /DNA_ID=CAMNT_0028393283 /DNA_START=141 /DNA_END=767 /DNA_ORIENTATION=+